MTPRKYKKLTRREFIKFSSLAAFAPSILSLNESSARWNGINGIHEENHRLKVLLTLSEFEDFQCSHPTTQGRVLSEYVYIHQLPSFESDIIKSYWRDSIIPINRATVSEDDSSHNPVWYLIGDEGYCHSGSIQPVTTILNQPVEDIAIGGNLAEITVPYTDARWAPGKDQMVAYRFYFATTHWIIGLEFDSDGKPWYRILDDKWEFTFFVPSEHLRIIPQTELSSISPDVPAILKRLVIHLPEQLLIAYESDDIVFMARVASGAIFSDGNHSTPTGRHMTFHKRPSRHMAAGNLAYNGYDLPGVPWICYITESGVAFHGTYWHNDYGRPRSHGCINLSPQAAKWVYRWTLPAVPPQEQSAYKSYGTVVDILN